MFDIVYDLVLDFISVLSWYIPILILFSVVGYLITSSKR